MNDKKFWLVLALEFLIALVFVSGVGKANHSVRVLYHSYFADVAIPFAFYFLLSLSERRHAFLRPWWVKTVAVFALCATSETLQFFGIFALARVFDPLDYVMYGIGALFAACIDRWVFAARFAFWE
jgi:uncharacterized membrane protein YhaH (DUF805 family)